MTLRKHPKPVAGSLRKHPKPAVVGGAAVDTADIKWSDEQKAFIDWSTDSRNDGESCVLEAVAGSGKTTTILEAACNMGGSRIILAYNKKIADELKLKLERRGTNWKACQASTMHGLGLRTLRKTYPDVRVDENKCFDLLMTIVSPDIDKQCVKPVLELVSLAKQCLLTFQSTESEWLEMAEHFGVDWEDGFDAIAVAQRVLQRSWDDLERADFDDMIYVPVVRNLRPCWRYDHVFIDEAQDTNLARRLLAHMHMSRGGRIIAVGDPHQAIYGFTGASADSLDHIRDMVRARTMHLGVCFRCGSNIIAEAQRYVEHIVAAPGAPSGELTVSDIDTFMQSPSLATAAVLSRTTRPLVMLAFRCIRAKIRCRIEGRDLGNTLRRLATKWKTRDFGKYEEMLGRHVDRMREKLDHKPRQLAIIEDTVETIRVIMDECRSRGEHNMNYVVTAIDDLFVDNVANMLTLSTIHKSKGREWPEVYVVDRMRQFNAMTARCNSEWQADQETNLLYVAVTRAMSRLIDLTTDEKYGMERVGNNGGQA